MIATTAEVINRVYPVIKPNNLKEIFGTAFTIREKGKEFLITAYHVAKHAIYLEKNIVKISLRIGTIPHSTIVDEKIIYTDEKQDIIICEAPKWMHNEKLHLTSTSEMTLGQDVMWMGYPEGYHGGLFINNNTFITPIGIVAKGILGGFSTSQKGFHMPQNENELIIEGRTSQGYSGGPVVLKNSKNITQVIGVINNFIYTLMKIKEKKELTYHPSFIKATNLGEIMKKVHEQLS